MNLAKTPLKTPEKNAKTNIYKHEKTIYSEDTSKHH